MGKTYQNFRAERSVDGNKTKGFFQNSNPSNCCTSQGMSEGAAEYYDMTTSDGNGEWNLDAVGNSGHRWTKCGSRKHGAG